MQPIARNILLALSILFCLAGCGGSGGGGDGGDGRPPSKLFVVDSGNRAIASMIDPNPGPGTVGIDRVIVGFNTGLGEGPGNPEEFPGFALDAPGDRIYLSARRGVVLAWDNAGRADGDVARSREISTPVDPGMGIFGVLFAELFIDTANDRLYATDAANGQVVVLDAASTLNGVVTPARTIKPDFSPFCCAGTFGLAVDVGRDLLYVGVRPSDTQIMVFNSASTINTGAAGSRPPDRTLLFPNGAGSFHLDAAGDRLYVAEPGGFVRVFDNASTLSGTPTADRSFRLGDTQRQIFVDAVNNRLYGVSDNLVFIIPNASSADGPDVTGTVIAVQITGSHFSGVASKP